MKSNAKIYIVSILFMAVLLLGIMYEHKKGSEWEKFKTEHHCVKIYDTPEPAQGKSNYKCDDGKTYFNQW